MKIKLFGFTITIEKSGLKEQLRNFAIASYRKEDCPKIPLIKKHRELTGSSLYEAKEAVEKMFGFSLDRLYSDD